MSTLFSYSREGKKGKRTEKMARSVCEDVHGLRTIGGREGHKPILNKEKGKKRKSEEPQPTKRIRGNAAAKGEGRKEACSFFILKKEK